MVYSNKLLDPKNDIAFKRIFGTEANKDILIEFLNDMLVFKDNVLIKDVTFLPTIQIPEVACQKTSIVDVLCEDEKGSYYVVEMQVAKSSGFEKRAQYYAAKTYSSQADIGSEYGDLKEVVFIAIADYIIFPNKGALKSDHVILDQKTHEHDLKDFSFTFLELPKFKRREDELGDITDKVELWCYFFRYAPDADVSALNQILKESKAMQKAISELNALNWSRDELTLYDEAQKRRNDYESGLLQKYKEGKEVGIKEGKEVGRQEGIKDAKREIIVNMLKMNMKDEFILDATQISSDDLTSIKLTLFSKNHLE